MSRVSELQRIFIKDITKDFDFWGMRTPPIHNFLSYTDTRDLASIATSIKYNADIETKYKLIDQIMKYRGFKKAHAGTNRVVYDFLEWPAIVCKVAIDRVGMKDNPAELENQKQLQPYCCRIFDVDETGVAAIVERVNPISSINEFYSVWEDIFYLISTKILGKNVLDDIGVSYFMNYGIRPGFGPVILDYPYLFELDGSKLICNQEIQTPYGKMRCGGEIDYVHGFDEIRCTKCNKVYLAQDLQTDKKNKFIIMEGDINMSTRVRVYRGKELVSDSSASSDTYISKEEASSINGVPNNSGNMIVSGVHHIRRDGTTIDREYKGKRGDKFVGKPSEEISKRLSDATLIKVSSTIESSKSEKKDDVAAENKECNGDIVVVDATVEAEVRRKKVKTIPNISVRRVSIKADTSEEKEEFADDDYPKLSYTNAINGHITYKMVRDNDWLIDSAGKLKYKGKYIKRDVLLKVIAEAESTDANDEVETPVVDETPTESVSDEVKEDAREAESDVAPAVESDEAESVEDQPILNTDDIKIGSYSSDDEHKYDDYVPEEYDDNDDDSDAVDMEDYASAYKEDNKKSKREAKRLSSNKNMREAGY